MAAIFELIDAGDAAGLRELLAAEPAAAAAVIGKSDDLPGPHDRTPDGFTGLHLAAFVDNAAAARALLEAGADPNAVSTAGFARVTPLGTCAFANAVEVARVLLTQGADPSLAEDDRATPLAVARTNGFAELAALLTP